jgi:uncharacterized membrane protein
MPKTAGAWCTGAAILACLACPLLAHAAVARGLPHFARIALLAFPLLAFAFWARARPDTRPFWIAALIATLVALISIERAHGEGLVIAYGMPHATAYLFLLWLFGRTLAGGGEALITGVARRIHGVLEPEIESYTRHVTIAWCMFFAVQLAGSALLLALAPVETWSLFVNVLNVPLLALMFGGEYLYRILRYPRHPRATLKSTLRAFAHYGQAGS